jgi:MFS-type transporter involved in bile tolerance (Atg22 family)
VSLVSAGMGMAPMTMSPLAARLVSNHDWRTSMQIVALVVAAIMIPVSLLVRRAPALDSASAAPIEGGAPQAEMSRGEALRSPQFLILLATNFFCCATHSGPIIHTVSYAVSCGIPLIAAVTIYSVEGLAGMGGRIAFGLLGDRFGAKRVARENFPLRMMGTVIGGTAMAGSLAIATGPLAGGLVYDSFASYAWLDIGSACFVSTNMCRNPFIQNIRNLHIVLLKHHHVTVPMNAHAGEFDVFILHARLGKEF